MTTETTTTTRRGTPQPKDKVVGKKGGRKVAKSAVINVEESQDMTATAIDQPAVEDPAEAAEFDAIVEAAVAKIEANAPTELLEAEAAAEMERLRQLEADRSAADQGPAADVEGCETCAAERGDPTSAEVCPICGRGLAVTDDEQPADEAPVQPEPVAVPTAADRVAHYRTSIPHLDVAAADLKPAQYKKQMAAFDLAMVAATEARGDLGKSDLALAAALSDVIETLSQEQAHRVAAYEASKAGKGKATASPTAEAPAAPAPAPVAPAGSDFPVAKGAPAVIALGKYVGETGIIVHHWAAGQVVDVKLDNGGYVARKKEPQVRVTGPAPEQPVKTPKAPKAPRLVTLEQVLAFVRDGAAADVTLVYQEASIRLNPDGQNVAGEDRLTTGTPTGPARWSPPAGRFCPASVLDCFLPYTVRLQGTEDDVNDTKRKMTEQAVERAETVEIGRRDRGLAPRCAWCKTATPEAFMLTCDPCGEAYRRTVAPAGC